MAGVVERTASLERAASSNDNVENPPQTCQANTPTLPALRSEPTTSSNLRERRRNNAKPLRIATREYTRLPAPVSLADVPPTIPVIVAPVCAVTVSSSVASTPPLPAACQKIKRSSPQPGDQPSSLPPLQPVPSTPYSLPPAYAYRLPPQLPHLPPLPILPAPALQPNLTTVTSGQNVRKLPGIFPLPPKATSALLLPTTSASLPVSSPFAIQLPVSGLQPKQRRRRRSPEEFAELMAIFEKNPKPCRQVREQLSQSLNMSIREVQVKADSGMPLFGCWFFSNASPNIWFQNQRAKLSRQSRAADTDSGQMLAPRPPKSKKEKRGGGKAPRALAAPSALPYPTPMLPHTPLALAPCPPPATLPNLSPPTPVTKSEMTFYSVSVASPQTSILQCKFSSQPPGHTTPVTSNFTFRDVSPNQAGGMPTPYQDSHIPRTHPLKYEHSSVQLAAVQPGSCGISSPSLFSYSNLTSQAEFTANPFCPPIGLILPASAPPWSQRSGTPPRENSRPPLNRVPLGALTPPPTASASFSGESKSARLPPPPRHATEEEGRTFADAMALLVRAAEMAKEEDAHQRLNGPASREGTPKTDCGCLLPPQQNAAIWVENGDFGNPRCHQS